MQILETFYIYKGHLRNDFMFIVVSHSIQLIIPLIGVSIHCNTILNSFKYKKKLLTITFRFLKPTFCNPNIIHTNGLKFILIANESKYHRKTLWTEKQKQFSLLSSLFCHHCNTVYLIAKYYIL